jgi:hypothetical protein
MALTKARPSATKVDYAPALVGWTERKASGSSMPLFQGVVVCAEMAAAVRAALVSRCRGAVMGLQPLKVAASLRLL